MLVKIPSESTAAQTQWIPEVTTYREVISADELAKMSDIQFLRYVANWAECDGINVWRLLVEQNARRREWLGAASI